MIGLHRLQKINFVAGILCILAINVVGALPRKYIDPIAYKGEQHSVGPEAVSVYAPATDAHGTLNSVQSLPDPQSGFVDTGQRVLVFLRNGYKDGVINYYPRVTLFIAVVTGAIHLLLSWLARRGAAGAGA